MAPAYKLTYFNSRGVTEPIRFIFKYANIEFEDVRVTSEEWVKLKAKTPFGQLPTLEHNGKVVNQSIAIARYAAKKANLAGNDDWENLEIDSVVDTLTDLFKKMGEVLRETDSAKQNALKEVLVKETLPFYLTRLDAIVKKNNGFLALGRLTWADFTFASFSGFNKLMETVLGLPDLYSKYPNLLALNEKVLAIPNIKKWVETRPKTER